jgi:hypothetical protein
MANKKISEFPVIPTLSSNDVFLINHIGTTSTVSFSTVSDTISQTVSSSIINSLTGDTVIQKLSSNFIKIPTTALSGQVLTYNGTTSTWVASAAPDQRATGSIVAWVNFDSFRNAAGTEDTSNTNRFIRASHNVSSVLKTGTGNFIVNFTNPLVDANYNITANGSRDGYAPLAFVNNTSFINPTVNNCAILFGAVNIGDIDVTYGYVTIIR